MFIQVKNRDKADLPWVLSSRAPSNRVVLQWVYHRNTTLTPCLFSHCTHEVCPRLLSRVSHQLVGVGAGDAAVVQTVLRTGRAVQVQDHVEPGVPGEIGEAKYKRNRGVRRDTRRERGDFVGDEACSRPGPRKGGGGGGGQRCKRKTPQ